VAIVPVVGLVFDVGRVDGNSTSLFFRSFVNFGIAGELGTSLAGKDLGDCSSQSGFTMIDVTYGGQPEPVTERPIDIPMVPIFIWGFDRVYLAVSA